MLQKQNAHPHQPSIIEFEMHPSECSRKQIIARSFSTNSNTFDRHTGSLYAEKALFSEWNKNITITPHHAPLSRLLGAVYHGNNTNNMYVGTYTSSKFASIDKRDVRRRQRKNFIDVISLTWGTLSGGLMGRNQRATTNENICPGQGAHLQATFNKYIYNESRHHQHTMHPAHKVPVDRFILAWFTFDAWWRVSVGCTALTGKTKMHLPASMWLTKAADTVENGQLGCKLFDNRLLWDGMEGGIIFSQYSCGIIDALLTGFFIFCDEK